VSFSAATSPSSTATSVAASLPTSSASTCVPSAKITVIVLAPSTTWALVMMWPARRNRRLTCDSLCGRLQGVARGRPTRGELDDPCLRLSAMLATVEPDEVVVAGCDCADRAGAAPSSSATAYAPIPAPARPAAARVGAASPRPPAVSECASSDCFRDDGAFHDSEPVLLGQLRRQPALAGDQEHVEQPVDRPPAS
jgi:hypothetical protein